MKRGRIRHYIGVSLGVLLVMAAPSVHALSSPHYNFEEATLGAGDSVESSSSNYRARGGAGDPAAGPTASANYQADAGSNTPKDPSLSFSITSSTPSFGTFSSTTPATATAQFSVSNYTSYGYVVQMLGSPPTNGSHVLPALSSNTSSQTGTEQFGINIVANTSPLVGANPDNGAFGFGAAAPNYGTANQFRFVNGETIALAQKSSGVTTYTLSYLVNVGSLTPGGQYTSTQTLIVTGTY